MEKWKYEIKEQYVWVGKWSAHIRITPYPAQPKMLVALITVPTKPVGKEWEISTYIGDVREDECVYCAPYEMPLNEALKRLMPYLKKQARLMIRLLKASSKNPFTGEEWQDERKKG